MSSIKATRNGVTAHVIMTSTVAIVTTKLNVFIICMLVDYLTTRKRAYSHELARRNHVEIKINENEKKQCHNKWGCGVLADFHNA